jgi:hypothetical protein
MRGRDEQPVFVIGNPRSGTSLLRLMLTSHPLVVIPPEAGFAVWLHDKYASWSPEDGHRAFVEDLLATRKFEFWNLDEFELKESLDGQKPEDYAGLVAAVYKCYAGKVKAGASVWGDKNNSYVREVDCLRVLFPNARFIHIVRDGRNVAVSYRRLRHRDMQSRYAPVLPFDVAEIAREWSGNVLRVEEALDRFADRSRALTTTLEDLTYRPRETLEDVCRLLELRFDQSMLEYHRLTFAEGGEPDEFLQWKERNVQPVEATDRKEYVDALSVAEIRTFEEIAGPALKRFGYVP